MRQPAQVRAVRRNITVTAATVGCDASRVTILGESADASLVTPPGRPSRAVTVTRGGNFQLINQDDRREPQLWALRLLVVIFLTWRGSDPAFARSSGAVR